jgi:hypothetical protein
MCRHAREELCDAFEFCTVVSGKLLICNWIYNCNYLGT